MGNGAAPKKKIAILGGGVGAVAAAYALTDGPNAGKYDVTVYQVGWRLGGKGASGRVMTHEHGPWPIEEHGLHVWFGFYYNALRMMEGCYDELDALMGRRDGFTNAFTDHDFVVLEDDATRRWVHCPMEFPRGKPGQHPTPLQYAEKVLEWILGAWTDADELRTDGIPDQLRTAVAVLRRLIAVPGGKPDDSDRSLIETGIHLARGAARSLLADLFGIDDDAAEEAWVASLSDRARWIWMGIDLGLATVRGLIADGVIFHGTFDVIDEWDVWDWLERHGAEKYHRGSVMVRTLYSQAFAFRMGQESGRSIAAGATLRAIFRMLFAYDGAFMRRMNAGMGDIVFAPFYLVLKSRGVRFKFFHRVHALELAPDRRSVARIVMGRQVDLAPPRAGAASTNTAAAPGASCCADEPEYDPLVAIPDPRVEFRPSWPNEPKWDLIAATDRAALLAMKADPAAYVNLESVWSSWDESHERPCVLEAGRDFDHVVLGISLGALGGVCANLVDVSPRWQRMVRKVETVRTQAFQLWMKPTLADLGWTMKSPISAAYVHPLDSWAGMNQILPAEGWPAGAVPGLIAYFCGVLPEDGADPAWGANPGFVHRQHDLTYGWMRRLLTQYMKHLWPNVVPAGGGFDWAKLVDLANGTGEERLRHQFWIANVDPTERYVLTVPKATEHRLPSGDSGFGNLVLAGDWTRNALNLGCVEAAVTSGMAASRAISGWPATIVAESD